jgi:hypothetical protein
MFLAFELMEEIYCPHKPGFDPTLLYVDLWWAGTQAEAGRATQCLSFHQCSMLINSSILDAM